MRWKDRCDPGPAAVSVSDSEAERRVQAGEGLTSWATISSAREGNKGRRWLKDREKMHGLGD